MCTPLPPTWPVCAACRSSSAFIAVWSEASANGRSAVVGSPTGCCFSPAAAARCVGRPWREWFRKRIGGCCQMAWTSIGFARIQPPVSNSVRSTASGARLLVGAASWLRPGKQLEHLFQIAANINHNATLVLAGGVAPGEEFYSQKLLADGQQLLGERLRFVGCLNDLRGFYNALDLYINTSKEETCSISIMESLACGCPVIGYPSVSVDEQVLPHGGEIVPQDDRERLTGSCQPVAKGH